MRTHSATDPGVGERFFRPALTLSRTRGSRRRVDPPFPNILQTTSVFAVELNGNGPQTANIAPGAENPPADREHTPAHMPSVARSHPLRSADSSKIPFEILKSPQYGAGRLSAFGHRGAFEAVFGSVHPPLSASCGRRSRRRGDAQRTASTNAQEAGIHAIRRAGRPAPKHRPVVCGNAPLHSFSYFKPTINWQSYISNTRLILVGFSKHIRTKFVTMTLGGCH